MSNMCVLDFTNATGRKVVPSPGGGIGEALRGAWNGLSRSGQTNKLKQSGAQWGREK